MLGIGASADTVAYGKCGADGDNLTWTLDDAGTLTVSGSGEMGDYPSVDDKPWVDVADRITSAVIGDGVTSIGAGAFDGCGNLVNVTIGSNVKSIGNFAFRNCGIKCLIIPEGITTIGNTSFRGCKDLESVIIPSSVEKIGDSAFHGCKSLARIEVYSRNATFGTNVFYAAYADLTIYGYADSKAASYASDNGYNFTELAESSPESVLGDTTGDGKTDTTDIMHLAHYIAGWKDCGEDSVNLAVLDLNLDGKVNSIDLIILARHLANWEGYESLPYITV